jgi:L-methionine (R)-S-oxide reductase
MSEFLGEDPSAYLNGYWLTDLSNFSSYVFQRIPDLNWCGFYLVSGETLRLGPFQGKPACMEIRIGRGVCGRAFQEKKSLLVPDVDQFPGHIACDSASRSEMVIPLLWSEEAPWGVFDLDSPKVDSFQEKDQKLIEDWLNVLKISIKKNHMRPPW